MPVVTGSRESVQAVPAPGSKLVLPKGRDSELTAELPHFVFAPVSAGDRAGTLLYWKDGTILARFPLVYAEEATLADPCIKYAHT